MCMGNRDRDMTTTPDIKGTLARLLATENLIVEHAVCETASFDVDRRVLKLPIWKDLDNDTYDLLVGHEVGHALFTPPSSEYEVPDDIPKSYVNVTEDARVEKHMKTKFPGLGKSFYRGYNNLHNKDFFGIKDRDLNQLKLIDRINLHCKIGAYAMIPISAEEQQYLDLVKESETFDDAVIAARVLWDLQKQEREKQQDAPAANDDSEKDGVSGESEQESNPVEYVNDDNGQQSDSNDDDRDDADLDTPSYEQGGFDEAETDTNLADNLANAASKNSWDEPRYIEIDNPDLNRVITPMKWVRENIRQFWNQIDEDRKKLDNDCLDFSILDMEFNKFNDSTNREVNYLVKEFEMKKSAASYARQTVSRTGVLDTRKLHTYKFNEDLFKKITSTPDGKNHGLIFLLDWSGSMSDHIYETVKQLLSLAYFCRKVNIPFTVYSFVYDHYLTALGLGEGEVPQPLTDKRDHTMVFDGSFHLVTLLDSESNKRDFTESAKHLFRIAYQYGVRNWDYARQSRWNHIPIPGFMHLGGTPLNEAIATLPALIPAFRSKHGVEKLNVVILTDGESNSSSEWVHKDYTRTDGQTVSNVFCSAIRDNTRLRHRGTGRVFRETSWQHQYTDALLEYVQAIHKDVNILGFRIGSSRECTRVITNYLGYSGDKSFKTQTEFKKNRSVSITDSGYEELYLIASSVLDNDVEFDVKEDATKTQIRSAFRKTLKGKAANKKILSSFVSQIA